MPGLLPQLPPGGFPGGLARFPVAAGEFQRFPLFMLAEKPFPVFLGNDNRKADAGIIDPVVKANRHVHPLL